MTGRWADAARRWGGPASLVAGVVWVPIWLHQRAAHGLTQRNEMNLAAGLTWMDTSKLLVVLLAFVFVGLAALYLRRERPGTLGRVGAAITFGGLALVIVTTALQFWTFPWGSYDVTFEEATGFPGSNASGAVQFGASLVFTVGLALLCIDLVMARVINWLVAAVLVLGALTTVYFSPVLLMPGIAWIVLGLVLLRRPDAPQGSRVSMP